MVEVCPISHTFLTETVTYQELPQNQRKIRQKGLINKTAGRRASRGAHPLFLPAFFRPFSIFVAFLFLTKIVASSGPRLSQTGGNFDRETNPMISLPDDKIIFAVFCCKHYKIQGFPMD